MARRAAEAKSKGDITPPTVNDLADYYLGYYVTRRRVAPTSVSKNTRWLNNYILPALGNRRVDEVTADDIRSLHLARSATYRVDANRMVKFLSRLFSIAIEKNWTVSNPCARFQYNKE